MNRQLFLKQLRLHLRSLTESETEEIISDYEAYFRDASNAGMTEEETIQQLGSPRELARDLIAGKQRQDNSTVNVNPQLKTGILAVAVIFFNVTILLGPVIGIFGALFGLIVGGIACIVSPVFVVINHVVGNASLLELFISFIFSGIGLLAVPPLMRLFSEAIHLVGKYIRWNMRLVKGEI